MKFSQVAQNKKDLEELKSSVERLWERLESSPNEQQEFIMLLTGLVPTDIQIVSLLE